MIIRRRNANLIVLVLMLAVLGAQTAGWSVTAAAQTSTLTIAPGILSQTIRSGLFGAQDALGDKDVAAATTAFGDIGDDIATFQGAIGADPAADLTDGVVAANSALAAGDPVAFATARTAIWTSLLRGAYEQTIVSASAGRADDAFTWLLVREFRPTTKFARPESDGTLAVRALARGETTPEAATESIRADLLDTYQGKLATELDALRTAAADGYPVLEAEAAGLIAGYWRILEPSYTTQAGSEANANATAMLNELGSAVRAGDAGRVDTALTAFADVERSFRAAPLSEEEQARRAGQLVRYLSLIPVEYGRGVKGGQVSLDIEIQEAQAFLDGAQAAFNDLYLPLKTQDPTKTAEVDESLKWLQVQVSAAAQHTAITEPGVIEDRANATIDTLEGMFPEAWTRAGGDADFDVIRSVLDQMEAAVAAGQPDLAESARLEAYAIYEVGPEKRLLAFAPDLANRTEQLFWTGDGDTMGLATALQHGVPLEEIRAIRAELNTLLAEGQQRLGIGRPAKTVVIFNAATIVFREGLEGVLILSSLVASMIGANRKFKRPLVIGAGLAFTATAVLFWLAQTMLRSLSRYGEKLEAIVSLVAIGVLLLVMNWFFHKVYWTKWISKHHSRRRAVIGGAAGQALGLVVLGFTSVFREGAETVLFLQALVLDAGVLVVIEGTVIGLVGTAIVGALVLVLQTKLPHKKMLMVTGAMIALVLVVMVGTTSHVLQVVGWLPITPVDGLALPYWTGVWCGLFPSWQGIVLQILALVFVVGSYYAAEYTQQRRRHRAMPGLATST